MSRISNLTKYPYDYNVTENDFVIGTDGDNQKTKNFPVVALAEYVRNSNKLSYSRVVSIGEITSENNNITINVADLGNVVYINEKFYTKNTPDVFTFTPVTEGVKIILLYALPDEQVFYMIEGVESNEAVEPDLPSGALFVQRIIVTVNGVEIIPNAVIISDNKVQITEDTSFANIGQSQKDFNKNVSDYKINADLKNQEQDDRMSDIEGYNAAQDDLINDLNSELDSERARNDAQDSALNNLEVSNIQGLQTALDTKFDKERLSSLYENYIPFLHGSNYFFNSLFYVDTTNYYYVGLNKTNPTEYLDVNGNIKANGFKTHNGTSTQFLMADGSVSILTNPITGTGTTNSLVKFLPDGTVGNSSIFDSGTNVGIGLIPISERLEIDGKILAGGFKKGGGTPTQALTANGGTFDLNTKADLVGGKVPSSQLPSYVDDVLEFANLASFPTTGESGKIYIAIDTNVTYRWSGTGYSEISASLALGETSNTAYRGDRGKIAYDHSQVTHDKTLVGLGNVDNTSDLDKPISTATQNALVDGLATKLSKGTYTGTASDLVPYNGALQDVNIASNYFKTSKGFNFTFDAYNYFNTYQSDYYSTLEFKSKDSSDDNFGYLQITANAEEGFNVDCVDGNEETTNSLQVSLAATSSPKVFVSGVGFKTPFGTVTQALTADGGVFDLNTKADLIDGKVPSSQLPSNKTTFTHDILVSNWTLVSGKYEAVISNVGILSNSFVDVIPSNDHVDIVRNAQIYPSVLISAGNVKVYSKFLPSDTITVTININ